MKKNKFKINDNYFHLPQNRFKCKMKLAKYHFEKIDIFEESPCIYIYPCTNENDECFVSKCFRSKFVFLNTDILTKISNSEIEKKELENLQDEIKNLVQNNFSLAIQNSKYPTIFGKNKPIDSGLAKFLSKTNLDIKILTFPGLYFAKPMWSKTIRNTKVFANQQLTIRHKMFAGASTKEITDLFLNSTPSSASTYLKKFQVNLRDNNLASGIEKLIYCCPACKTLFSVYSECSCLKCKSCGTAIEFSENGKILFSNTLQSFDDIESFLTESLAKSGLKKEKLIKYQLTQIPTLNCKINAKNDIILQIYPEKIILSNLINDHKKEIMFEDMEYVELHFKNIIIIKPKNAKELYFYGNNNENFLIIKHLFDLNNK